MISSIATDECGYGQGIASGWKSSGRGTKLQISAPRAANVPCHVGGKCTELTRGWNARIGNAHGYTEPSQPTTSSGDSASWKPCHVPARRTTSLRIFSSLGPENTGRLKSRSEY